MRLRALWLPSIFVLAACTTRPAASGSSTPSLEPPQTTASAPARRPTCTGPRCLGWSAVLLSGGRDRDDNVIAHERNLAFASRTLASGVVPRSAQTLLFGDGNDPEADVSLEEPDKLRHRLLTAVGLLRSPGDEGREAVLRYRDHEVEGAEKADFRHVMSALGDDARAAVARSHDAASPPLSDLFLYVTDHGLKRGDLTDNVIVLWGKRDLTVRELGAALDAEPVERRVVSVMAQCFSGSFAALVHEGGDPRSPIAAHDRCGFFAAPADRPAAGCSPKSDESLYDDYTTRFFSALGGVDRAGRPVRSADLDADGRVSFEEAHLAAIREEHTQDVPVSSSEELLRRSRPELIRAALRDQRTINEVMKDARPPLRTTVQSLLASVDISTTSTLGDLHERTEALSARCWPGLCEADDELKEARMRAHMALRAAAQGTSVPLVPASLALVLAGRPRIEQWIAAAQPYFDRAIHLEAAVERLRSEAENAEARIRRASRLVELAVAEEGVRAEGGDLAAAYARVRACETSGLWERDAPVRSVASSDITLPRTEPWLCVPI